MRRHPRPTSFGILAFLLVAVLAISACAAPAPSTTGTSASSSDQSVEVSVEVSEWNFQPREISVPAGATVTMTLVNKGVIEHDILIPEFDFNLHAAAGESATATFVADKAGEFAFECTLPGHKQAGMVGKLLVNGSAPAPATTSEGKEAAAPAAPAAVATVSPELTLTSLPRPQVAPPVNRTSPETVKVEIETREITATLADGVAYTFWTFNGTVPGPMVRVRQGDTVEVKLKNAPESSVTHSIDLHAVTGPGGGATVTQVPPGGEATFTFKALNPGVYVYHCATPMVAHHIASGMYGLIVVEPPEGLPPVDHEFYVMQGDFYLSGERGQHGHHDFDLEQMLDERPDYVVFNGGVGSLTGDQALKAKVGETVRIFFGVGGPNLTSSFHVIGEIFDRVYPEGASEPQTNVQTTLVPTGGATMVEFTLEVPGTYVLVDHSLGRLEKGAAGHLIVEGPAAPEIFQAVEN